jgi:hypothetical protein
MSDENDQPVAGPSGGPGGPPASSQSPPPPPAGQPPVTAVPGVSRRERLRRAGGRRWVQLLAAGLIGGIVGGTVVGALGAVADHDHRDGRFAEYQRPPGPFMRGGGPYWRYRGGDGGGLPGGDGWYGPVPGGKVPGQGGLPASPVPVSPAPVSPAPSATAS